MLTASDKLGHTEVGVHACLEAPVLRAHDGAVFLGQIGSPQVVVHNALVHALQGICLRDLTCFGPMDGEPLRM